MLSKLFLLLLLPQGRAARYHLCNFTCSDDRWLACRSEKCTPRLPEDACRDGSEADLLPALTADLAPVSNDPRSLTDGVALSGPAVCETLDEPPRFGSFEERCDLCMSVARQAVDLRIEYEDLASLRAVGAAALCEQAAGRMATTLPTVRTCRLHPPACAAVIDAAREKACPDVWEHLVAGSSTRAAWVRQQELCGALMTQRNGSGVDSALICPVPRDVGARVMGISAVVGACLFALQWVMFR